MFFSYFEEGEEEVSWSRSDWFLSITPVSIYLEAQPSHCDKVCEVNCMIGLLICPRFCYCTSFLRLFFLKNMFTIHNTALFVFHQVEILKNVTWSRRICLTSNEIKCKWPLKRRFPSSQKIQIAGQVIYYVVLGQNIPSCFAIFLNPRFHRHRQKSLLFLLFPLIIRKTRLNPHYPFSSLF